MARPPVAGVTNGGIVVDATGGVTLTDVVQRVDGSPVAGVSIDLFRSNDKSRRAAFLTSVTTDQSGRYRLSAKLDSASPAGQAGPNPATDCLVAVFVAPAGLSFEETGQYREALICPTEAGAVLPQVQMLADGSDGQPAASASVQPRSVLAAGGKLYLRGAVADDAQAAELARRYQWSIGSARVISAYSDEGETVPALVDATPVGLGPERVSIDGSLAEAFEPGTANLGKEALYITRQMATVLKWNPTARLQVIVAKDPGLNEQLTQELIAARQQAAIKGLGPSVSADRVDLVVLDTVTEGRRLGGRSINSQLEFVLLWP